MMKFDEKYNHDTFCDFLRAFLPEDYTEKEQDITEVDKCKIITKAKELGYSESLDVYVLEMTHAKDTDPRVTIATDAFRILAGYGIDKALVIFKNDDSDNYRFSYLTITLDLNEKNKIVRKYSNARRYSFYLGVGAKVKTPEQQLITKGHVTDTDDLLSRFSLEVVNKEFYKQLVEFFDKLTKQDTGVMHLPGADNEEARKHFGVRLIGRIIFTWFLKQKKSDKGQLVPDEILSSKVITAEDYIGGYYHDRLERLFFELLNTQLEKRDLRSELYDLVPYLNGGLFSPHIDDHYKLNRTTGYSESLNTLKIEDSWFKHFFEFLETYNFTIDENTTFDQELSIDPEMLGRIFENLLAEIDEDTGESARKATGSFYTPREVVSYMVDESLRVFLNSKTNLTENKIKALISYDSNDDKEHPLTDTDKTNIVEAISELTIFDPACGSGAFPIGALQKLVYILHVVDEDGVLWRAKRLQNIAPIYRQSIEFELDSQTKDYIRKIELIEKSIYGVDIQPIATEVARLRTFLTLIVDEEINDEKDNRGIKPLPNLEFKFVSANTLVSLPDSNASTLFEADDDIKELANVMSEYFSSREKDSAKTRFLQVKDRLYQHMIQIGHASELTHKLATWDPFSDKSSSWFDPKWMFGVEDGFDIVIGNPPYIQLQKSSGLLAKQYKDSGFVTFEKTGDIYPLFYERGLDLLKNGGHLIFITSNKWMRAGYGKSTRAFLAEKTNPLLLVDFAGQNIFQTATVDTNILLFRKENNTGNALACTVSDPKALNDLGAFVEQHGVISPFQTDESWVILSELERGIHEKIKRIGKPLKEWDISINYGVKTGFNEAFIISGEKKDELIAADPKSAEIIRPILRGRDIKRYTYEFANLYLIATFPSKKYDIDKYPAVKEHLLSFGYDRLKQTGGKGSRKKTNNEWFETQDSISYWDDFSKQKIVWGNLNLRATYCIAESGMFINAPCAMIVSEDKSLLAILNSKLADYYIRNLGVTRNGGYFEYKPMFIEQLPVLALTNSEKEKLSKLVERRQSSSDLVEIDKIEKEIDEAVYLLYELGENEVEIIENSL